MPRSLWDPISAEAIDWYSMISPSGLAKPEVAALSLSGGLLSVEKCNCMPNVMYMYVTDAVTHTHPSSPWLAPSAMSIAIATVRGLLAFHVPLVRLDIYSTSTNSGFIIYTQSQDAIYMYSTSSSRSPTPHRHLHQVEIIRE